MSIASDIKRIVEEAYAEAGTGSSVTEIIRRRIAEYMSRQAVKGDARKGLDAEVRRQVRGYLSERDKKQGKAFDARYGTKAEQQKRISKELASEVERAQAGMQRAQSRILPSIQRAIETAARTGADPVEIARKAARRAKRADAAMQAEISTAKASIDRIMRMKSAVDSGYQHFRYAGPTVNTRPFCSMRVNGVFLLSEIRQMTNGHGLPVESHCGGYNCRHRWVPVTNKIDGWQQRLADAIDAEIDADFVAMFGNADGSRIVKAFDLGLPTVGMKMQYMNFSSHDAEFQFQLTDVTGKPIGKLTRTFENYSAFTVQHEYFKLDKGYQGRNSAKTLFANSLDFYDEIGVERIDVHAGLDGGHHVWAKFGFEFYDHDDRDVWAEELADYIHKKAGVSRVMALRSLDGLQMPLHFISFEGEYAGTKISGMEWKRKVYYNDWHGYIDLNRGSRSRRILESYLRKKK